MAIVDVGYNGHSSGGVRVEISELEMALDFWELVETESERTRHHVCQRDVLARLHA